MTPKQAKLFEGKDPVVLEIYFELKEWLNPWNLSPKLRKDSIDLGGPKVTFVTAQPQKSALLLKVHSFTPIDSPMIRSRKQRASGEIVNEMLVTSMEQFNDAWEVVSSAAETYPWP